MTEQLSPQNNENNRESSANIFQTYVDELSKEKKDMIAYLDSLNFSDFHERVMDIESYYSSAITFIHNSELEYNNLVREVENDINQDKEIRLRKINNYKIYYLEELEEEKKRFIDKCEKEKESIKTYQSKYN